MKKKLMGILVMTLLIATVVLPAVGSVASRTTYLKCMVKSNNLLRGDSFNKGLDYQSSNTTGGGESGLIYVLVDSAICNDLTDSLNQYADDVENDGFSMEIRLIDDETPEQIRSFLSDAYLNDGLIGCLLVGEVPSIMCKDENEPVTDPLFPSDYYYWDLDGEWNDTDDDGIYDFNWSYFRDQSSEWKDQYNPEIWIGRITPHVNPSGTCNEMELIRDYFYRNHQYRTYGPYQPHKAAIYRATWGGSPDEYAPLYSDVTVVENSTSEDYLNAICQDYEWIKVISHGSGSSLILGGDNVKCKDIINVKPTCTFYVICGCECCDFTYSSSDNPCGGYIGGWHMLSGYGLLVIGQSAIGRGPAVWGGPGGYAFFKELSNNKNFGDALKISWNEHRVLDDLWKTVILGDPTLSPTTKGITNRPNRPNPPVGPNQLTGGKQYDYIATTIDSDGDQIWYWFDWGDGTNSGWVGPCDSGESCTASHIWMSKSTYVKVKAKDSYGAESIWSDPISITVTSNPPSNPIISGYTNGKAGNPYTYDFTSTDPDGDDVSYFIKWGDGSIKSWTAFQTSGSSYSETHTWTAKGAYTIEAKAKDICGTESGWTTLEVSMPKNKQHTPLGIILAFGFDVDVKIVQLEPGEDYVDLEVLNKPFYIWENEIETINPGAFIRLYNAKGLFSPSLPFCFGTCQDWSLIG